MKPHQAFQKSAAFYSSSNASMRDRFQASFMKPQTVATLS